MRKIDKREREPAGLAEIRTTPGTAGDWSTVPGDCKQAIRNALVEDQGFLCAYCMSQIAPEPTSMKIEHWRARSHFPEQVFDWKNLLGVCPGTIETVSGLERHCDESRENQPLHIDPTTSPPDPGTLFQYTARGEIRPAPGLDPALSEQVEKDIQTLRLNVRTLRSARKRVHDEVRSVLSRRKSRYPKNLALLRNRYARPQPPEPLEPYCQVAIQLIERNLRRSNLKS